jgi:hypothetical protein
MVTPDRSRAPFATHPEGNTVRRPTSRGLSALGSLIAALSLAVAACGGSASSDPYELLIQSSKATWSPVQINLGIQATGTGQTVSLDPANIAIVVDSAAGKGAFHLSLPAAQLGIPAASLAQLGITGSSIDIDIVDDGQALYAKSVVFQPLLQALLGSSGKLPSGDLTGWLKLGTNAELAAFGAMAGGGLGGVKPSASASAPTAASLKSDLEAAGITLTFAGVEKRNGADAQHLKVAIDSTKLANNPNFAAGAGQNYASAAAAFKQLALSGDVWLDSASKHLVEMDLHIADSKGSSGSADLALTAKDPDGSVSLAGPASSVDVPMQALFGQVLQMMGQQLGG